LSDLQLMKIAEKDSFVRVEVPITVWKGKLLSHSSEGFQPSVSRIWDCEKYFPVESDRHVKQ